MSIKIKCAFKRHNTWVYRRIYPKYLKCNRGFSNKLTYALDPGGISDTKKREIVDWTRLPNWKGAS